MSNSLFPQIPGYPSFPIGKIANWGTRQQRSVSGRTLRSSDYVNPVWNWTLSYPGLHDYPFCSYQSVTEFRTIEDFYNSRAGAYDAFLFEDPTDNNALAEQMVAAPDDLTGQIFQLVRRLAPGGRPEWITAPNVINSITVGGAPTIAYTLGTAGLLTFTSPPGATPVATFSYYFPARFTDALDAQQFLHNLWELKQVKLQSIVSHGSAPIPTLIIALTPAVGAILDSTPLGTTVATVTVTRSDGLPFGGSVGFGLPYLDDGGRFIITGAPPGPFNLVLNPSGPGLPASRSTEFVTVTAFP